MEDLIKRLTSWKTTIIGVATAIISLLVFFDILRPDNNGAELVSSLWDSILQLLAAVSGVILIFTKDPQSKKE